MGKQLDVVLRKQHIKVGVKGQEPVIEGDMPYEIKVDDSTWTLGQSAGAFENSPDQEMLTWCTHRRRFSRSDRLARKTQPASLVAARRHDGSQDRHDQDHARELETERPRRRDARHGRKDDGEPPCLDLRRICSPR